jgi:hypothetical protein
LEKKKKDNWEDWCGGCWEEWWENDLIDSLGWAAAFIWAGLVLLAETKNFSANFTWWDGWAVFFTGAGVIVLSEVVIRLVIPRYRTKVTGGLIFGLILLGIGLGDLLDLFWPLVLIAIGAIILLRTIIRRV